MHPATHSASRWLRSIRFCRHLRWSTFGPRIQLVSRKDFYAIEEKLLQKGFGRPIGEEQPICRWMVGGVIVDVMPIDPAILGFSNQWYPIAFHTATLVELPTGTSIRVVTA